MIENRSFSSTAFKQAPKTEKARARFGVITESAARIFAEKGYDVATVEDIADACGILKGSLYYYLSTKEDLLFALVTRINEEAIDIANATLSRGVNPLLLLRSFARDYTSYNAVNAVGVTVYYRNWQQLSPDRREIVREQRAKITKFLTNLITEAQDAGLLAPGIKADLAAYFFFGASNWVYTWFPGPKGYTSEAVAEEFADRWITSLLPAAS
jgi:AcrR family transcriptional regulator